MVGELARLELGPQSLDALKNRSTQAAEEAARAHIAALRQTIAEAWELVRN